MKLNKKKIIAREFLILMVCALVFGLAYLGTLPYNYFVNSKIYNLENESQSLRDSIETLTKSFSDKIEKQKWFYEKSNEKVDYGERKNETEVWQRWSELEKVDSIDILWSNRWDVELRKIFNDLGFENSKELKQFIKSNSLSTDEINQNNSVISLNDELDEINSRIRTEKYKVLDADEKTEFALACLIIFGILSFPLRYLIYAIRWSIKTLKQKE